MEEEVKEEEEEKEEEEGEADWARNKIGYTPQRGDILFFLWREKKKVTLIFILID